MGRKRRTPEQIIRKLREAEVELGRGLRDTVVSAQEVQQPGDVQEMNGSYHSRLAPGDAKYGSFSNALPED